MNVAMEYHFDRLYGRSTDYEQEFYCENIFTLYAQTLTTDDFLAQ